MAIKNTLLTGSNQNIIPTIAAGTSIAVTTVFLCNNSGAGVTVDLYVCEPSASPSATNIVLSAVPIDPNDTFVFSAERMILSTNSSIQASCSTPSVVAATVSYVDI
jgi:type IV secretory pathway protease TraF